MQLCLHALQNSRPCKQTRFCLCLTRTTRSASVHYQRAHLCRHGPGTAMRSWAPWCGPAFNWVLSWAKHSHGLLLMLLWVCPSRFEALCKNCTNRNVLEDDGICVYASSASLRPFNPSIQLSPCPSVWRLSQAFDMIYVTILTLGLSVILTRPAWLCSEPVDM